MDQFDLAQPVIIKSFGTSSDTANNGTPNTTDSLFSYVKKLVVDTGAILAQLVASLVTNGVNFKQISYAASGDNLAISGIVRGDVVPLVFAGAGDSVEINCELYNGIILTVVGSATVTVKGTPVTGGTVYACSEGATAMTKAVATGENVSFKGIPQFVKINVDAACTVYAQPVIA